MQSNKSSKIKAQPEGAESQERTFKAVIKLESSGQERNTKEVYFYEPQQRPAVSLELATSHEEQQNVEIICPKPECRNLEIFSDKTAFEEHFRDNHRKDKIQFGCSSCDYTCKKFNMLKNHYKKHILKKFQCGLCLDSFPQKSQLNSHKTLEHNVRVCRCKQEFDNIEAYLEHRNNDCQSMTRTKINNSTGLLECEDCKKNFTSISSLFTHRKMHNETPKFKCQICQKEFFQKINLTNHTKTHNAQNRSFSCTKCDKKFFERSHLQRHQNFHNMSRDFKCTECGKFYKTERCLKVHKQVHSEKRPFRCDLCQKGFLSSTKLKQHTNVHFNLRPFLCKHCPRDFTNYPNLLKHTIRRHKVDHRTGNPIVKVPAYVTNKKKKKNEMEPHDDFQNSPILVTDEIMDDKHDISIIHISDEDFSQLPLGTNNFGDNDEDSAMHNYSSMILDIDQEFSDFQLLSPEKATNDWNNIIDL